MKSNKSVKAMIAEVTGLEWVSEWRAGSSTLLKLEHHAINGEVIGNDFPNIGVVSLDASGNIQAVSKG